MAALWVEERAPAARLVVVGRPKRWLERFDLVVAPPQFRLPPRANVLPLDLPLMRVDDAAIRTAADAWKDRLGDLPRPLIGLLVGGPTKPYVLDARIATRLLEDAHRQTAAAGGTLYVTTSRRTPPAVIEALEVRLPAGARLYRWDQGGDNPYWALLGLADRFIVTGDSISMMVEVARLGKPLAIFSLPKGRSIQLRNALGTRLAAVGDGSGGGALEPLIDLLYRLRIAKYSRDLTEIHRRLIERGLAVPFGARFQPASTRPADDLMRAVERIRALMAGSDNSSSPGALG
jgi:mitochondrial fission protein ELM1